MSIIRSKIECLEMIMVTFKISCKIRILKDEENASEKEIAKVVENELELSSELDSIDTILEKARRTQKIFSQFKPEFIESFLLGDNTICIPAVY